MPRCTMHRRHTVVRSCVGPSVPRFVGSSDFAYLVSGEFQVLKVGQYAKNDILVRWELVKFCYRAQFFRYDMACSP